MDKGDFNSIYHYAVRLDGRLRWGHDDYHDDQCKWGRNFACLLLQVISRQDIWLAICWSSLESETFGVAG